MAEDRYILAQKIARGGMAEIYLGKHIGEDGFQRICVIKRILPHYAQDKEFVQMFRDEAHICKRLQHANIVRVEGFEEVEGSYALIMEFVNGADLRTLLHACEQAGTRLTVPAACHIIAETARGLHYAHTKVDEITNQPLGIVHRDISPQNILISYEGEIKVTDFGIADAESKITETRPGVVKGKYSYMSPEQISAKQVDARTDVFALAIVLWEMLGMRRMFQGENEVETIQMVKACRIDKDLRQLNPEVTEELDLLIKKGLAKDPKKRFKSALDFEKTLRRFMSRAYPDFTPEELGTFLKKVLEKKRLESASNIKKTLTETNLKSGSKRSGRKRSVDLTFEEGSAMNVSVARPTASGRSLNRPPANTGANLPARTNSAFKPSYTKTTSTGYKERPWSKRNSSSSKISVFIAAGAIAVAAAFFIITKFKASNSPAMLTVRSNPTRVKIQIDKTAINKGRYVNASTKHPVKIPLTPGRHRLIVTRDGYRPYTYIFVAEAGEEINKTDILLRDKTRPAKTVIRMKPADRSIKIDINNGFYQSTLTPKRSGVAPDLRTKKLYKMKVYPNARSSRGSFECKFKPMGTSWKLRTIVTIDPLSKSCKVKNP